MIRWLHAPFLIALGGIALGLWLSIRMKRALSDSSSRKKLDGLTFGTISCAIPVVLIDLAILLGSLAAGAQIWRVIIADLIAAGAAMLAIWVTVKLLGSYITGDSVVLKVWNQTETIGLVDIKAAVWDAAQLWVNTQQRWRRVTFDYSIWGSFLENRELANSHLPEGAFQLGRKVWQPTLGMKPRLVLIVGVSAFFVPLHAVYWARLTGTLFADPPVSAIAHAFVISAVVVACFVTGIIAIPYALSYVLMSNILTLATAAIAFSSLPVAHEVDSWNLKSAILIGVAFSLPFFLIYGLVIGAIRLRRSVDADN